MAFLIKNGVIINDNRELVGVNTAGINTALYVGGNIQLDAASGIVTATSFAGSGADLTNIDAQVIVSDGIPTGISTAEGDLYYDSTDLKLFTYYDNNWVEASPTPPGATNLEVTNEAGISTVSVDLLTETLVLSGTTNEIEVGVNSSTNTLSIGLPDDVTLGGELTAEDITVSAGGSVTAPFFYGNGSNLTNLQIDADAYIELQGVQAGVITATSSLEATLASGTGLDVTANANIGGSLTVSGVADLNGNVNLGTSGTDLLAAQGRFITGLTPQANDNVDLGTDALAWRDLYLSGKVSVGGTVSIAGTSYFTTAQFTDVVSFDKGLGVLGNIVSGNNDNITGFNTVSAAFFEGDGSKLTGIGLAPDADIITTGDIQAGVITATTALEATVATGVGLTVTSDAFIGGDLTADNVSAGGVVGVDFLATRFLEAGDGPLGDINFSVDGRTGIVVALGATFAGVVTATSYEGSGANLTDLPSATAVNSQDNQDNTDYRMPFLSAVGAGASVYVDETTNEEFTYNPSTGILKAKEFDALSDRRLKTDIVEIDDALGKVSALRGVEYNWVNGSGSSVGVIAQELQEVYPQLVSDSGERLTVNYNGLVGLLIAAVNEISAELAELKAQK